MGSSRLRLAAVAMVLGTWGVPLQAADDGAKPVDKEIGTPNQDYLDMKAALEQMVSSRDMDLYEVSFEPIELDSILLMNRLGREDVYHYLAFRVRNKISDVTKEQVETATRYNEVLKTMAEQYESAKIENNVTLKVDGEEVLDRKELRSRNRTLNLTALAYDENGSRIKLIDEPIGSGVQEKYNFPDLGDATRSSVFTRVREKIEEKLGRRLLTMDQIRKTPLPPYNADKVNEEGVAEGELFGVLIFNRLTDYGDSFTIQVRGLNNKFRIRQPDSKKNEVDNYLQAHYLRRVYVLHYSRPGDEFYRDQDKFVLGKHGWEWIDTFQRVEQRSNIAYANYFVDNIADDKGERNTQVESEFWPYYNKVREAQPAEAKTKLDDIEKDLKER